METLKQSKKLMQLGAVALCLALIQNILFFNEGLGINYPLFIVWVLLGGWIVTHKPNLKVSTSTFILIVLAIFFSAMVFVRSSELLTFFNVVGSGLLLLILVDSYVGKNINEYLPGDYIRIFLLPFAF